MKRFAAACLLLLNCVSASAFLGTVTQRNLSVQAQVFYNTQGSYPASALTAFGVNSHLSNSTGAIPTANNIALMQAVHAKYGRVDSCNWDTVELSLGVYTWTTCDSWLTAVGASCLSGITPIFVATYNNNLYTGSGVFRTVTAGANTTALSNWIVAGVNRYATACPGMMVEAFNEANLTIWTTTQWLGSAYAAFVSTVATAIKAAQPGIKVITSGASPGPGVAPNPWIAGVAGAGQSLVNVDAYGLHPYSYNEGTPALTTPPWFQLPLDVASFAVMAGSGGAPKPTYVTEYGVPLQGLGATPTTQLNAQGYYAGDADLVAIALKIPVFIWYDLIDDGINYSATDQNTFGLFYNGSASSGNPVTGATPYGRKPAGTAISTIEACKNNLVGNFTLAFDAATQTESETFPSAAGACIGLFTLAPSAAFSKAIGTFSAVTCADVIGNAVTCTYVGGTLSITLAAGTDVIVTAVN